MSYLISLGSRQGDVVLDPFLGSGTTGIAAKILHREFVGIEIDPESFKIAEARIKAEHQVILTEAAAKSPPESSR
jgi:site-specific DNA-methyltransferase (adenine-specific)